ncbi:ATP-binding protein [Sphingomonas aerophila]|uniref:histidine kinase n=1 Tax=Sphingomonas aerophila TaxID=1344948 RepID=A0A7W9BFZ9_9SPHN|nr:ATP-binding protein [Sphingomonas aerophila]MBB5716447.1 PAS domain S-box-containing protein [Sphingomonas aerophila]
MQAGAGLVVVTEEALATGDMREVSAWIDAQPEWSDLPFVLLTHRGGGLERNPRAARALAILGNVTFIERPFHPTTLISLADAALRGRRRQYDARARLEQLVEGERQFRTLADSIPTLCWTADPDGTVLWFNQRWYDYTGMTPVHLRDRGWRSVHEPAGMPALLERWNAALSVGEPFETTVPLRAADGSYRSFLIRVDPVRNAQGQVTRWFGTATDISKQQEAEAALRIHADELEERVEQRTREREQAQDALRQAQKMEAIGQLTGGVAHDFNNLLTVIRGSVDLLRRPDLSEERRARYIDAIGSTADRAAKLTGQLLAFARRQALTPELFDAGLSLSEVTDIIRTLIGSRVQLDFVRPATPAFILADRGQFDTAIVNMAVNARDAMNGEGTLTIATSTVSRIPAIRGHAPVAGDFLAVSITDSGSGISEEDAERIFQPFFTTKAVGQGTGLGLSQVIGFAKQSGGDIQLDSMVGKGTTFTLYLPRADTQPVDVEAVVPTLTPIEGEGVCVLVVEDNEQVGAFATQALRELGYASVLAPDGTRALAELSAGHDRFQIVFSDVVMPGMSGVELAGKIRRLYPDLPVVLASGYSHILAEDSSHGFELLHKPYSIEQLSRMLSKTLARRRLM